jgi:cytochrome c peroxidase
MFSDFQEHNIGVPQVVPSNANVTFDGPGADEDFGLAQVTGKDADRYRFRSSPLRNVSLQPAFMHNGAFVTLEAAIRHHLDVPASARAYSPSALAPDLRGAVGPIEPVLAGLDPLVRSPIRLSETQFNDLVAFVGNGLLDPRARPTNLRSMVPVTLPSGNFPHRFEFQP